MACRCQPAFCKAASLLHCDSLLLNLTSSGPNHSLAQVLYQSTNHRKARPVKASLFKWVVYPLGGGASCSTAARLSACPPCAWVACSSSQGSLRATCHGTQAKLLLTCPLLPRSWKAPVRAHVQAAGFTVAPLLPRYTGGCMCRQLTRVCGSATHFSGLQPGYALADVHAAAPPLLCTLELCFSPLHRLWPQAAARRRSAWSRW